MKVGVQTYIITIAMPNYVNNILEILGMHGFEAYIVGGCVRDSLLGLKPKDWDIASNARTTQIQQIFNNEANFDIIPIGLKYGTLGIKDKKINKIIEITTYRTDGVYKDGRRPESIQFITNIQDDLSRRDFTINALACKKIKNNNKAQTPQILTTPINNKLELNHNKPNNIDSIDTYHMQLVDYHNGLKHIKMRNIVCVGNAEQRFLEDSLRIIRAIRFCAVLPFNFTLDNKTKHALHKLTNRLNCISKERIQNEFAKLLCGQYTYNVLPIYKHTIFFIMPILKYLTKEQLQYNYKAISLAPKNIIIRLVLLCCPISYKNSICNNKIDDYLMQYEETCKKLHFNNKTIKNSLTLLKLICSYTLLTSSNSKITLKQLLLKHDIKIVWQLINIYVILQKTEDFLNNKDYVKYNTTILCNLTHNLIAIILNNECYKLSQLAINGNIIQDIAKSMYISLHGEQIGKLLENLLQDVIEEKILNDTSTLTIEAKKYINKLYK